MKRCLSRSATLVHVQGRGCPEDQPLEQQVMHLPDAANPQASSDIGKPRNYAGMSPAIIVALLDWSFDLQLQFCDITQTRPSVLSSPVLNPVSGQV